MHWPWLLLLPRYSWADIAGQQAQRPCLSAVRDTFRSYSSQCVWTCYWQPSAHSKATSASVDVYHRTLQRNVPFEPWEQLTENSLSSSLLYLKWLCTLLVISWSLNMVCHGNRQLSLALLSAPWASMTFAHRNKLYPQGSGADFLGFCGCVCLLVYVPQIGPLRTVRFLS